MSILWVQANHTSAGSPVTSQACPFSSNNTLGNLLVAVVGCYCPTTLAVISVTDSAGNTWKRVHPACGVNFSISSIFQSEIWYAENCISGANTVTVHGTVAIYIDVVVREFLGAATSASLDQAAFASYVATGNSTSAPVGPVTTLFANELLVSFFANSTTNGLALTPGSGYTLDYNVNGNYGHEYQILLSGAGNYSGGGSTNSSVPWCAAIATFKPAQVAPVISGVSFSQSDTTIVGSWTTNVLSDSNMTAGGKAAIDEGCQTQVTSHQAIVTGLSPNTMYSCAVTSGGVSSTPQNITTSVAPVRTPIISASNGSVTNNGTQGDTIYSFVSNDNVEYNVMDDGKGWGNSLGSYIHMQLDKLTNESTLVGSIVNQLTAWPPFSTTPLNYYFSGLFGMGGSLYGFATQIISSGPQVQKYGGMTATPDHGVTWNSWMTSSTFSANGIPPGPNPGVGQFIGNPNFGWATPVRYAVDDGTLGYLTTGNRIDGGDGFVYIMLLDTYEQNNSNIYLARIPRAMMTYLSTQFQYWIGPASPTPADFVSDLNWQSGTTGTSGLTVVYSAANHVSAPDMVFIPTINRYVLLTFYYPNIANTSFTTWVFSEAPTPAGPWTQIYTQNNTPTGYYSPYVLHRTAASNVLSNSIPLALTYTSDYSVTYQINRSILTLFTAPPSLDKLSSVQTFWMG